MIIFLNISKIYFCFRFVENNYNKYFSEDDYEVVSVAP